MDAAKLDQLKDVLNRVWAEDTCYPGSWNKDIPCKGQCEPTACVVQDLFGGDIYKIDINTLQETLVASTGVDAQYIQPSAIDSKTNTLYWAYITAGGADSGLLKGYKVEGLALRQLRTHGRFNRKQRYENLKRRVAEVMDYPGVVARGLNTEKK